DRIINRSSLVRALAASRVLSEASVLVRRSIAALAIAEVEPALLRTETAAAVIEIMVDVCTQSLLGTAHSANSEAPCNSTATSFSRKEITFPGAESEAKTYAADGADVSADYPRKKSLLSNRLTEATEKAKPIDLRERAFTRWGGLLFLLAVFEDLNLVEVILEHPVLRERPFTWVLHQLAQTIAPVSPNDPAALAFAGLAPDIRFKPQIFADESDPPSSAEICGLRELAASMIDHLSSFLVFDDEPPASLTEFVCRRRAEIVVDPGWIEVR